MAGVVRRGADRHFALSAPEGLPAAGTGDAGRDPEQPVGELSRPAELVRLSGQDEERGLERVLGGGAIAQDPGAYAEDERTVPADQLGERRLVALAGVAVEQVGVRNFLDAGFSEGVLNP